MTGDAVPAGGTAPTGGDEVLAVFEAERGRLFGLAYRMLGSAADAEDAVQDAWLRWSRDDRTAVASPAAWLTAATTNLCLNRLGSARARRERYVGPWLPEPVPTADGALGPLETAEQRESVSIALLALLERLSPPERAVFVLRESFGHPYAEIARILDRPEAACRQLHHRAKERLGERRPRYEPDPGHWRELVERFLAAAADGDLPALEAMLAADVTYVGDGGGRARTARRPVVGRDKVARLVAGMMRNAARYAYAFGEVNGAPALLARPVGGGSPMVVGVDFDPDGRIARIHNTANPDKLALLDG